MTCPKWCPRATRAVRLPESSDELAVYRLVGGFDDIVHAHSARGRRQSVGGTPVRSMPGCTRLPAWPRHSGAVSARPWLGGVGVLDHVPPEIDAVVSPCRVGTQQVPARIAVQV